MVWPPLRGDKISCCSGYFRLWIKVKRSLHMEAVLDIVLIKVSTGPDVHAILGCAERIKFHVIGQQKRKNRRSDARRMNDGTLAVVREKVPTRNTGGVGFVIVAACWFYPLVVHPADSHGLLSCNSLLLLSGSEIHKHHKLLPIKINS
ncbi:hypothetical protein RB195_018969 [Necator americanus]|uniref:Uncharacterized protein n=1 Tax=Necator americanus TaxID=51031 RepID=A0ABR1CDT5_NECAM